MAIHDLLLCFASFSLVISLAQGIPDLYVESLSVSPDPVLGWQEATLFVIVRNVGPDIVPASFSGQFSIDGQAYGSPVQFPQGLLPGESKYGQRSWFPQDSNEHTIGFFVDPSQSITELNETAESNYREIRATPVINYPDLVVTDIDWEPSPGLPGVELRITAEIKNIGSGTMTGACWVDFFANETVITGGPLEIYGPILPGQTVTTGTTWTPPHGGSYDIRFYVDTGEYVHEEREDNNDRTETLQVIYLAGDPDLVVADFWLESGFIRYCVYNNGDTEAESGFAVELRLDGELVQSQVSPVSIPGRMGTYGVFTYQWGCSLGSVNVAVCVDSTDVVAEEDEENNCRTEVWRCDERAPVITQGPSVTPKTTSATIVWETDEASDTVVMIDDKKPVRSKTVSNSDMVKVHSINVKDLLPAHGYAYYVTSSDPSGNTVQSRTLTFFTLPEPDGDSPTLRMVEGLTLRGIGWFRVNASDNAGVDRVLFSLDGVSLGTDYSFPFECIVNTTNLENGEHTMTVTAFDLAGNSRTESVRVGVDNHIPFSDAPSIGVYSPRRDETISAECTVNITAYDPDGMDTVEVYMDAERIYSVSTRGSLFGWITPGSGASPSSLKEDLTEVTPRLNIVFSLDTLGWDNGAYQFKVRGWDLDGNTTEHVYPIGVFNEFPRNHPDLVVTRPDTVFDLPGFQVKLRIRNAGNRRASGIVIQDLLHGFYPTGIASPSTVTVEGRLSTSFGTIGTTFAYAEIHVPDLEPDDSVLISYQVMPYLREYVPQHWSIGGTTIVHYNGSQGDSYSETIGVPCGIARMVLDHGITMDVDLNAAVGAILSEMDYIIVTCPANMPILGTDAQIGRLVQSMACLAYLRQGTLAFLESDTPDVMRSRLCDLIWEGGAWSDQLVPDYEDDGYLLIVGETEIIPSWYHGDFDIRWSESGIRKDVEHCDTDYGDSNNNWRPEIIVGRIIGNTAEKLRKPIEASIAVAEGTITYDRSRATIISGYGSGFETFIDSVNRLERDLDPEYGPITKIHMVDRFFVRDFDHGYTRYDGLAIGDVMGDARNEIVLARDDDERVFVYDDGGLLLAEYGLPRFDDDCVFRVSERAGLDYIAFLDPGNDRVESCMVDGTNWGTTALGAFSGYYDFDVGNVDSDATNEYVVANAGEDTICVLGQGCFAFDFTSDDRLAVGDVMGDSRDEIIVARNDDNTIFVYDGTGALLSNFTSATEDIFTLHDRLAVGDVWGGSKEEILIAMDDDGYVHAYSYAGADMGEVYVGFTRYDKIAAGNLYGDAKCEIVLAKDDDTQIYIADFSWANRIVTDLQAAMPGADVIAWSGHGNIDNWACFSTLNVPASFGAAAPFVYAVSCLTGNYESGDDGNIAEKFLENGAAVYIGSTMDSPREPNVYALRNLFDQWFGTLNWNLGRSFKETEREVRNAFTSTSWGSFGKYWVAEYNFYGDPKFGKIEGISAPASPASPSEPLTSLQVSVPAPTMTKVGQYDLVEIPAQGSTLEIGMPRLPVYVCRLAVPAGWRVASVELLSKSQESVFENVSCAPVVIEYDGGALGTEASYPEGWYPSEDFFWLEQEEAEGTSLILQILPATYNPLTKQLRSYSDYLFTIGYVRQAAAISNAWTDSYVYEQGDILRLEAIMDASGLEPATLTLEGLVCPVESEEALDGTFLRELVIDRTTYVSLLWEVDGSPGAYAIELTLRDAKGDAIDSRSTRFWIDGGIANITSLRVEPDQPSPGESMKVALSILNGGTHANGTAWIWLSDEMGRRVRDVNLSIPDISAGSAMDFRATFDLEGVAEGSYMVNCLAILDGASLAGRSVAIMVPEGLCQFLALLGCTALLWTSVCRR